MKERNVRSSVEPLSLRGWLDAREWKFCFAVVDGAERLTWGTNFLFTLLDEQVK